MKRLFQSIILFCYFWGFSLTALATQGDYSVSPLLEDNQAPEIASYFDVTVTPETTQKFRLRINNHGVEDTDFLIEPNRATTNSNGVIDYNTPLKEKGENRASFLFEELVTQKQTITVPAGKSKDVSFSMSVPKDTFKGILLGGFVVIPINQKKSTEQIINVYTHTIAAVIRESTDVITPELNLTEIGLGQVNRRNAITIGLENSTPTLIRNLQMAVTITKEKTKEVIQEQTDIKLNVAPNSSFTYPLLINDDFESGNYHVALTVANSQHKWQFASDFTIKPDEKNKFNAKNIEAFSAPEKRTWTWHWVLIIVSLLVYIIYQKKQVRNTRK